jgi:hypothetical protein
MVDIDKVQAHGFVAHQGLSRTRLSGRELLPTEYFRAAMGMEAHGFVHQRLLS